MKKICWITPSSYLDTDVYVVPLLSNKFEIDWFILYKDDYSFKDQVEKAKELKTIRVVLVKEKYRQRSFKTFIAYWKFIKNIKSKKYDIHYMGMFGFPYFHIISSILLNKQKVIIAAHNVNTPKGAVNYHYAKAYCEFILSHFTNFHTFSNSQHDLLLKKYPNKNVLMTPFMLKDYGQSTIDKPEIITFLSFGNIRDYKRIDVLIKSAQNVYETTGKSFRVIIAGQCDEWDKYQRLIKHPHIFDLRIEKVEDRDIPNLFAESHYFVTPYQDIAQSGSVIVGINYECPIISSDLEAFREYVIENDTGYLIRPASEEDLTRVMEAIVNTNNENYKRLSSNVARLKNTRFSKDNILSSYIQYFMDLCKSQN